MKKNLIFLVIVIVIVLVGSYLIYKNDAFISPETKVERILDNPEKYLEGDTRARLIQFMVQNDNFVEMMYQKYTFDRIYDEGYQIRDVGKIYDETLAQDRNVDYAVISIFSVYGFTQSNGGHEHLGSGFSIFFLNKNGFTWEVVEVLTLPIKEGQSGYSYPDDFNK